MTAQERIDFEQKLSADAELKGEFEFQQRVADGIRHARATELKARLKNIPTSSIPPAETTTILVKMGWWAAAAGLIMAGFYLYFNAGGLNSRPHLESATRKIIPEAETPTEAPSTPSAPQQEPVVSPTEQANPKKEDKKTSKSAVDTAEPTERALDVFDPSAEMETPPAEPSTKIENNTRISTSSTIAVETENNNKKYDFHYQFKDGKLLLYGAFERNLYEIMEFFTENKRTIFLFYKNNYYLLSGDNEKVKPLTPITDAALLKKLREVRKN